MLAGQLWIREECEARCANGDLPGSRRTHTRAFADEPGVLKLREGWASTGGIPSHLKLSLLGGSQKEKLVARRGAGGEAAGVGRQVVGVGDFPCTEIEQGEGFSRLRVLGAACRREFQQEAILSREAHLDRLQAGLRGLDLDVAQYRARRRNGVEPSGVCSAQQVDAPIRGS